eukprot:scpid58636/ scgid31107/ 
MLPRVHKQAGPANTARLFAPLLAAAEQARNQNDREAFIASPRTLCRGGQWFSFGKRLVGAVSKNAQAEANTGTGHVSDGQAKGKRCHGDGAYGREHIGAVLRLAV